MTKKTKRTVENILNVFKNLSKEELQMKKEDLGRILESASLRLGFSLEEIEKLILRKASPKEVAQMMIKVGVSHVRIAKLTNLSLKEILELEKEVISLQKEEFVYQL